MTKLILICGLVLFASANSVAQQNNQGPESGSPDSEDIFLTTKTDGKDQKKIILQWSCAALASDQFFTIERSKDGKEFDVIGAIKGRTGQGVFEFTDEMPSAQNNFYRIRSTLPENKEIFSKIISRGVANARFCSFYPNPVEKYLIIRTESPVEVKVVDQLNKVRISKQLEVGLQLLDVGTLEKGMYFITLYQKESNRLISDKLIKH
jgi:hypothetical protein